jgi:hypothetical protein
LFSVTDPAPQRRATVAFRSILAIPHYIALYFLNIAASVILFIGWWCALFTGRLPEFAESFLGGYLRWTVRVNAYLYLLTDMYPPFSLDDDPAYPVRLAIPPAQPLNRAAVFFRILLAIPASIVVSVVTFGAGTLGSFVAWLITLIAGQLPRPFHLAFTAVLRYSTRLSAYVWLLTPAYPSGLYGELPGTTTWADEAPGVATPGFAAGTPGITAPAGGLDTPGWGAGTPGQGYGDPSQGYAGPDQGSGTPASVYGGEGYGNPGYPAPGGFPPAPVGYGFAGALQPVRWPLLLTPGARRLLTTFITLGALFIVGYVALIALLVSTASTTIVNSADALSTLDASYTTLTGELATWEKAETACQSNLSCVTRQDATAAADFSQFGSQLAAIHVPASAAPEAAQLAAVTSKLTSDFTALSQATTVAQYQSTFAGSGLQTSLTSFDSDFNALRDKLRASF